MEIPLNTEVECTDVVCGKSEYMLINPILEAVTALVVKEDESPHTEYIVPVEFVAEAVNDSIRLSISKAEVEDLEPFVSTTFIEEPIPERNTGYIGKYFMGPYYFVPYVSTDKVVYESVKNKEIPAGELTVRRGMRVKATDGFVGKVDEFVVNPENNRITHLVMREGHLWGKRDVVIPLSALAETSENDTVRLNLSKHEVESLPTLPLRRAWS